MPRAGSQVMYIDHLDREALCRKYEKHEDVSITDIPEIDFVVGPDQTFRQVIGDRRMAYAIASHVIEHVPDFIGWLADIHEVLEDRGVLALAVPDMRRCFDAIRTPTTIAECLDAYFQKCRRPSPSRVYDALSREVSWKGAISWHSDPPADDLVRSRTPREAYEIARKTAESEQYFDVHCWTFTPETFRALCTELSETGLLSLCLLECTQTLGHEFFVRLQRDDHASQAQRVGSWRGEVAIGANGLPEDFDPEAYYMRNPDVREAGIDAEQHYRLFGCAEGRSYR